MGAIDLNCDLGEGYGHWSLGDDDALLRIVTSANVACGFHAGDATIMRGVCERAVEHGVAIGAQVGYQDLAGFGRRFIDIEPPRLTQELIYQIGALDGFARVAGSQVRYVKPHGALYNAIVHHAQQAQAVVQAVLDYNPKLPVVGLAASAWLRLATEAGLSVIDEAFADRAYTPQGTLVPRAQRGAILTDADEIARRCLAMASGTPISDINGDPLNIRPASICVHGDTPGAATIARRVRVALEAAGLTIAPFS